MQDGNGTSLAGHFFPSSRYLAAFQLKQVSHFFTDILVIGSGLAGFRAALGVDEKLSVLVVTKDELHFSNSDHVQGGVAAALDADNRGGQVPVDYPEQDDEHWTRHIIFCRGGDRSGSPCQENIAESRSGRRTEPGSRPMPRAGLAGQ
jgi:succinate dehydrogenase/fumarate reductase flavoprotein subunit